MSRRGTFQFFRGGRLAHHGADLFELGSARRLAPLEQGCLGRGQRGPARLHPLEGDLLVERQTAIRRHRPRCRHCARRPTGRAPSAGCRHGLRCRPSSTFGRSSAVSRSAISPQARQLKPTFAGTDLAPPARRQVLGSSVPIPWDIARSPIPAARGIWPLDQPADVPNNPPRPGISRIKLLLHVNHQQRGVGGRHQFGAAGKGDRCCSWGASIAEKYCSGPSAAAPMVGLRGGTALGIAREARIQHTSRHWCFRNHARGARFWPPRSIPTAQRQFAMEVVEQLRCRPSWPIGLAAASAMPCWADSRKTTTSPRAPGLTRSAGCSATQRTLAIGAAFGVITVLGKNRPARSRWPPSARTRPTAMAGIPTRWSSAPRRGCPAAATLQSTACSMTRRRRSARFRRRPRRLAAHVIRAIGQPLERFRRGQIAAVARGPFRGPLRLYDRACHATGDRGNGRPDRRVSIERITMELRLILVHPGRRQGVELLDSFGLLERVLPTVWKAKRKADENSDPNWRDTLVVLDKLEWPSFPLALAALTRQLLNPGQVSALVANLKLSNAERNALPKSRLTTKNCSSPTNSIGQRCNAVWLRTRAANPSRLQRPSSRRASSVGLAFGIVVKNSNCLPEELNPPLLITGDDLVKHGVPPGSNTKSCSKRCAMCSSKKRSTPRTS